MASHNLRSFALLAAVAGLVAPSGAALADAAKPTGDPQSVSPRIDTASRGPIASSDRISSLGFEKLNTDAQISSDDGTITAHLSLDYSFASDPGAADIDGTTVVTSSVTNVSAKVAVPLNSADKGAEIDFKNFGNKAKFTLNFNHFAATYTEPGNDYGFVYDFAATCVSEAGQVWSRDAVLVPPSARPGQIAAFLAAFRAQQDLSMPVGAALDKAAEAAGAKDFGAAAVKACRPGKGNTIKNENVLGDRFAKRTLSAADYKAWRARNRGHDTVFFFGADLSAGYNRFTFANPVSYTEDRIDRVGFDASFHAGLVFPNISTQLALAGGYTRRFETLDEVNICSPANGAGATQCAKGIPALPVASDTGYVELIGRKVLLRRKDGTPLLAIAPSVSYVFEDKDFQAKLPIFFQRNEKGGLDAGVQAVWNNATRRFAVGAFVGVPFGN